MEGLEAVGSLEWRVGQLFSCLVGRFEVGGLRGRYLCLRAIVLSYYRDYEGLPRPDGHPLWEGEDKKRAVVKFLYSGVKILYTLGLGLFLYFVDYYGFVILA